MDHLQNDITARVNDQAFHVPLGWNGPSTSILFGRFLRVSLTQLKETLDLTASGPRARASATVFHSPCQILHPLLTIRARGRCRTPLEALVQGTRTP